MSITITVSESIEKKIRKRAEIIGENVSKIVSDLVEEVWDEHFPENETSSSVKVHSLFEMAGMFRSDVSDTSERMQEILYAEDLDPAQGFGTDK